jgi:hypothetical protein
LAARPYFWPPPRRNRSLKENCPRRLAEAGNRSNYLAASLPTQNTPTGCRRYALRISSNTHFAASAGFGAARMGRPTTM